jgi:hypothetical protein
MRNEVRTVSLVNFERAIELVTEGLLNNFKQKLISIKNEDALIIARYILSMKAEVNLSDNYRKLVINVTTDLIKFHCNKSLEKIDRDDILMISVNLFS